MPKRISFALAFVLYFAFAAPVFAQTNLSFKNISDNLGGLGGSVPKYEKFEITFEIDGSVAENYYQPYNPLPPSGVPTGTGISVDAYFTDPEGNTFSQPAFYFQDFLHETRANGSRDWIYPNGNFFWKVRFAPNKPGLWQYRLITQDASGRIETSNTSFNVSASQNKGYIRVSPTDPRYFEFDDGTYFPALGYNMNFNHVNWVSPVINNQANFKSMGQNGVQMVRIWLSQWAIFGSSWNPWKSFSAQGGDPPTTLLVANVGNYVNSER